VVPTPTPAAPPPTQTPAPGISFWADSYNLNAGQSTTIHWRTQGVKEVYFYQEGQSWQNYPVSGNEDRSVRPNVSTTYYLRVVFPNGAVQNPSLRINVQGAASWPVITRFDSDPDGEVCLGDCVELKWHVDGADRVALVRDGGALWDGAPSDGSKEDCGITSAGDHMYELQAWGPGGTGPVKDQLWIEAVVGCGTPPPQIAWFNADPSTVLQGQCVNLSWDVQGDWDTLWLAVNGNQVAGGAGTYSYQDCDCPQNLGTCNYQLHVSGPGGEDNEDRAAEVIMQTLPGNPAATYCTDNGGQYDMEQDTCTLSDGTVCDAWAYVNEECP
jgi:putative hemolysin